MPSEKPKPAEDPNDWKKKVYKKGKRVARNHKDRYVVPNNQRGGWDVKREDAQRSSGHFNTQKEAIDRAREIVDKSGGGRGDVRIQRSDGKSRDSGSGRKNESPREDTR